MSICRLLPEDRSFYFCWQCAPSGVFWENSAICQCQRHCRWQREEDREELHCPLLALKGLRAFIPSFNVTRFGLVREQEESELELRLRFKLKYDEYSISIDTTLEELEIPASVLTNSGSETITSDIQESQSYSQVSQRKKVRMNRTENNDQLLEILKKKVEILERESV
ncbi:hypothetical protein EVAR_61476_1 [Eumeta japonica]|uniref:Uncharacterized protein n=1 Tax=Eumeta variegata TaxID=151549 RepID=A0A4C1ZFY1_EUMVA|nr:hypothetical protein EVAR_61476_1 [Eumeta japonica]